MKNILFDALVVCSILVGCCFSVEVHAEEPNPQRGLDVILNVPFNPPWFDQKTFDALWKTWPEPLRTTAEKATLAERRDMAFKRYGLTTRPGDNSGKPLQFVVDDKGQWTVNCFSCHTGQVGGKVYFGVPNVDYAAETLLEDLFAHSQRTGTPLPPQHYSGDPIPVGSSDGVTNAFMITLVLLAERDADLNRIDNPPKIALTHHDLDAPAWWRIKKRKRLYVDGFAKKSHRALMQMLLDSPHGPKYFHDNEVNFQHVLAWLESLEPPNYSYSIDGTLAHRGKSLFENHCAQCHGTYGPNGRYPEKTIPLSEIGTDPLRLKGVTAEHREIYEKSWFAYKGKHKVTQPKGYIAPPLDGIWSTAPYFHNGSVPTLWHVMNPDQRPTVWKKTSQDYDQKLMGLQVKPFVDVPDGILHNSERRKYYDTREPGKSAAGHDFPEVLTEKEKRAVLEYLKTL